MFINLPYIYRLIEELVWGGLYRRSRREKEGEGNLKNKNTHPN